MFFLRRKATKPTAVSHPKTTKLEDAVVEYFKSGYTDLNRLADALGYKSQVALYDAVYDVRVKVMILKKGTHKSHELIATRQMVGTEKRGVFISIHSRG